MAVNPHKFDPLTEYCVRCGCSRQDYVHGYREKCDEAGNVSGISHFIARRIADKMRATMESTHVKPSAS